MDQPILTFVTGTHNRLEYLQDFMDSCRCGVPAGIDYNFSICDGKSTDGTLEWLKSQPDVILTEHGELKGAIKAFNDAAAVANGMYLVIANDDVVILHESIARALSHLIDNPNTGAVAFYQDRGGQAPHVEHMHVVNEDGSSMLKPYMQVGMIPKWLWDHCGGWGDFGAMTYGGDNYVSAKIYEAGYSIDTIENNGQPGCMINDRTPIDELRIRNNKINTGEADGKKFYNQFPNGIKYNTMPQVPNPLRKLKKILYAPIFEPGREVQKQQKKGLRDSLKKYGVVWEVDYYGKCESIIGTAEIWKPHLTLTQIHNADIHRTTEMIRVREVTKEYMVNWCGDTWSDQQRTPEYLAMLRNYNLQTGVNASLEPTYERHGIPYLYWQNSFEKDILPSNLRKG